MAAQRTNMKPIENEYKKAFGNRLRAERNKRNWSQSTLAAKIGDGTRAQTVSRWEQGDNFPNLWSRDRLCSVLEISADKLFHEFLTGVWQETESTITEESGDQ